MQIILIKILHPVNEIVFFDNQIRKLTQIVDEYQQSGLSYIFGYI